MCFSPQLSALVGAGTLAAGLFLRARGARTATWTFMLYWSLMEALQLAQYAVVDQCDSLLNQALTWAAFVHVAFQPLAVNSYFLVGQRNPHPEVGAFVAKLCWAYAAMSLARTPLLPITWLGDRLHTWVPDLPTSSTLGTECHFQEAFCGPRTCSFTGGAWGHVSWSLPLAPTSYFLPSSWGHCFLFFFPTLVAGDWVKRILISATVFIGPLSCMAIASADMATYRFEWATIWCFFAAIQSCWAVGCELFLSPARFRSASAEELATVGKSRNWSKSAGKVNGKAA